MKEDENRDNMAGTTKIESKFFILGTLNGWIIVVHKTYKCKGKGIKLQALTGPEGSRRLRLQDFKTISAWTW
jgi:hypothetical protein